MIWWIASAWAECTFRADLSEVSTALEAAETAYVSLDVATAARLHRLRGLGRFAEGDSAGAVIAMSSAPISTPTKSTKSNLLRERLSRSVTLSSFGCACVESTEGF